MGMENNKDTQWRCPKCETINSGDHCIVCGEKKGASPPPVRKTDSDSAERRADPAVTPRTDVPRRPPVVPPTASGIKRAPAAAADRPDRGSGRLVKRIIITLVSVIFAVAFIVLCVLGAAYFMADNAMENGDYESAKRYLTLINTERGQEMKTECDYQIAESELSNGNPENAKAIYQSLGGYKDSEEKITECDYETAVYYAENDMLFEAYDAFSALGNYSDSLQQFIAVKEDIYYDGVAYYEEGAYDSAEDYFNKSVDFYREDDYLLLIKAHRDINSVTYDELLPLIDFEDTTDLMESDEMIESFLIGRWTNSLGYNLRYYRSGGDSITCSYYMPISPAGEHWVIEGAVQKFGSNADGWTDGWSIDILTEDMITVTIVGNGMSYAFFRD